MVRRTTLLPAGLRCHSNGAVWSRYGNACACASENAYTDKTQPTIAQAIAGTVRATVDYKYPARLLLQSSRKSKTPARIVWAGLTG